MKSSVRMVSELDPMLVLSPERYTSTSRESSTNGLPLGRLVSISKEIVSVKAAQGQSFLVADTGDAEAGVLKLSKPETVGIGSAKKALLPGDVIVSRLRPYLRQVAYVDEAPFAKSIQIVASTEFYVLRSVDDSSVAFLVPWLLSKRVQDVLSDSVEGAHHPRFSDLTLLRLTVPASVLAKRDEVSSTTVRAVEAYRRSQRLFADANALMPDP